jgi:integrase
MVLKMTFDLDNFFLEHGFSVNTSDRYSRALTHIFKDLGDLSSLTPVDLHRWLRSHNWASSTTWLAFCAIKCYLRWKYGAGHPALRLKIRRDPSPPQRFLRMEQIEQLLQSFDTSTIKGRRDLSMAGIFLDSGLRVSEVCRLETRYLDLSKQTLDVIIKGGSWSHRVYSVFTAVWLSAWLADREKLAKTGHVFISIGGNTRGHQLTRHGLQLIVRRWGRKAGIGVLSPHDFRRSMATNATILGCPEDVLMKAGGWKSHNTIRLYTIGVRAEDMKPWFPTAKAMS